MLKLFEEDFLEGEHPFEAKPFSLIGKEWMLITAGNRQGFNTMTASWGGFGYLWERNVAFIFVRPTRHTYGFIEAAENYSLSFFDKRYRKALEFCGANSGRSVDKIAATGLTPSFDRSECVSFEEARLTILCRKLYHQDIDPSAFVDPTIDTFYPRKDYHRMYVGEVVHISQRQLA